MNVPTATTDSVADPLMKVLVVAPSWIGDTILAQPLLTRGTVIMANMAVFRLGPTALGIAQPYAPGPASDHLERRGPGPFQALYRTTSMGAAARWIQAHGLPPPARGTRNDGQQAMLVTPGDACGAYIGFVGPE